MTYARLQKLTQLSLNWKKLSYAEEV